MLPVGQGQTYVDVVVVGDGGGGRISCRCVCYAPGLRLAGKEKLLQQGRVLTKKKKQQLVRGRSCGEGTQTRSEEREAGGGGQARSSSRSFPKQSLERESPDSCLHSFTSPACVRVEPSRTLHSAPSAAAASLLSRSRSHLCDPSCRRRCRRIGCSFSISHPLLHAPPAAVALVVVGCGASAARSLSPPVQGEHPFVLVFCMRAGCCE